MKSRTLALIHLCALICAVLTAGCSETPFPATPTPLANAAPVVNLGGANYQGSITLSNGTTTSFNMTLIARGLGITHQVTLEAQAPGTVEITGSFETGSGLSGNVRGMLDGTLENGTFQGSLDVPGCTRGYAGPLTASGFAWTPTGSPVPGCPLTFVIQIPRPLGPGCTYAASPSRSSFSGNGGTGTVTVAAPAGCVWAAESLAPWISIAEPVTGTGAGMITFSVASNPGSARQGTMRVAGQTIGIDQGPACSYSVVPSTTSVPGSGGTGNITITTPGGCEWTASSSVDWLTLSASTGTGGGVLTFTAQPNSGPERQVTLQIAGQSVTITQGPQVLPCNFLVAPASLSVPAAGGSGTIAVTGPAGCEWKAQSGEPWVTLSPAGGSGSGTVTFTAQPNTGSQRQATLQIAGRSVTIIQGAACSFSVSPLRITIPAAGETGSISVVAPSGCEWTAQSSASWITLSPAKASGNGTVSFTAQANSGARREANFQIAGQLVQVEQLAAGCVYLISPQNAAFQPAGGTGNVAVTARSDCSWTATSNAPWIQVTSGASGQGSGTVSYTVQANSGANRTATVLIAGQTFTVTQGSCTYAINPTMVNLGSGGATGAMVIVMATAGCSWTARSNDSWITITAPGSGTGDGQFTYDVMYFGTSGGTRTGTVSVTGGSTTLTFTVNQTDDGGG